MKKNFMCEYHSKLSYIDEISEKIKYCNKYINYIYSRGEELI